MSTWRFLVLGIEKVSFVVATSTSGAKVLEKYLEFLRGALGGNRLHPFLRLSPERQCVILASLPSLQRDAQ